METDRRLEHEVAVSLDAAKTILVFDYFGSHQRVLSDLLKQHPDYEVVLFATRNHPDLSRHSVFEILQNRNPLYVLTNDIPARIIPTTARVQGMSHGDVVELPFGGLTVRVYSAEDNAIAFTVNVASTGETIFYGEALPGPSLTLLSEQTPKIDFAFTPAEAQPAMAGKVEVKEFVDIR